MRKFNKEGPVEAERHYCIPPLSRIKLAEILELIAARRYFVLHAPRQTGKTSILLALQDRLNTEGEYRCVYVDVEGCQEAGEDTARATRTLLADLASRSFEVLRDDFVESTMSEHLEKYGPGAALGQTLVRWSATSQVPLVLLTDEIDTLVGDSLISVVRQLRANYDRRPSHFPQSVILCGVRDVRDYQIYSSRVGTNVKGGSAFNIKAESLRLGDFSQSEVRNLLAQYTAERGQAFEAAAVERIWALTCGQPWPVNALAYEACFSAEAGNERSQPIQVDAIDQARETLILRRVTHLDQLATTLSEERVRRVILPMLAGSSESAWAVRDLEYVRDLGPVASDYPVRMVNPIYAEVIPRELVLPLEATLAGSVDPAWYVQPDGSLDVSGLLSAFQGYFRENAESWVERYGHAEAGPQLVLHAYLQRVVNSGGR
ncbi:MAG: ATP-binding protein, partial [Acidobacteriia bacterium]|nr:ATP-binding protein [Terriglobia bacterium]